ncbi:MAG: hypothetical protein WCC60_15355 [Ilumatobacteraceae bacterium]
MPQPFAGRNLPPSTLEAFARFAGAETAGSAPRALPKRRKKRRASKVTVLLLLLSSLATGVARHFRDQLFPPKSAAHPEAWDPRVVPLVGFVETERGLQFEHPVFVDFLAEADFIALFAEPVAEAADPDEQTYVRQASGLYNAKGLAVGYNPVVGEQTVSSVATLGFYSPADDRVFVRGDVLTPAVRTVLAHELTHALQGQHFDLDLGGENDLELRSVVEADAMRVEDKYRATLTPEEQAAIEAEHTVNADQAVVLDTVPDVVTETMYAPYELGPLLVETVYAAKGNAGIDELIANPPSEMLLIDPSLYGSTVTDETIVVEAPEGVTVLEASRRLSALDVLLMLDTWLPWDLSRGAIDHWTGGGYVSYEQADGVVCFSAVAQFAVSADSLNTALMWWAGASGSTTVPTLAANRVAFTSCDRGPAAAAPPEQTLSTLSSLLFEHAFVEHEVADAVAAGDVRPVPTLHALATCRARALASDQQTVPLLLVEEWTPEQSQLAAGVAMNSEGICGVA